MGYKISFIKKIKVQMNLLGFYLWFLHERKKKLKFFSSFTMEILMIFCGTFDRVC